VSQTYLELIERQPRRRLFLLLNLWAGSFYCFIAFYFGFWPAVPGSMFATVDAQTYQEVAEWLYGVKAETTYAALRPYFYPLLLGGQYLGGVYAIWLMQFLGWLATLNLMGLSAFRLTGRTGAGASLFILFSVNVSLIALTFHALTESVAVCLTTGWVFLWVRRRPAAWRWPDMASLVAIMAILLVIKPLYQLHLFLCLVVAVGWAFWRGQNTARTWASLALALGPVFIQLGLMFSLYQTVSLSKIGGGTLREYYFSKVYMRVEGLPDLEDARRAVSDYPTPRMITYLGQAPLTASLVFGENMAINFLSRSNLVERSRHYYLFLYSAATNFVYSLAHLLFLPAVWRALRAGPLERRLQLGLPYLFFILVAVSSGLSFFQGDRLIIVAMPFWAIVYAQLVFVTTLRKGDSYSNEPVVGYLDPE
jgi:hypothetical protein